MSIYKSNDSTPRIHRIKSHDKKIIISNPNSIPNKKILNKNSNILNKKQNLKIKNNEYSSFYTDENYNQNPYKISFYETSENNYINDTNYSYSLVEKEEGNIENFQNNKGKYKKIYSYMNKNKKLKYKSIKIPHNYLYEKGSIYSNNENEDNNQELKEVKTDNSHHQYQNLIKHYLTQNSNNNNLNIKKKIKKINNYHKNISNRINYHQNYFNKDSTKEKIRLKGAFQKYENNTIIKHNTFNNIYYINPTNKINNNKIKNIKNNFNNNNNLILKRTNLRKILNKDKDYFKINNITDNNIKKKYIKAAVLIQSIFRGYKIKIKIYNSLNIYLNVKNIFDILKNFIMKRKKIFWKLFTDFTSRKFYDDLFITKEKLNEFKEYLTKKIYNLKEKNNNNNSLHKELGDSFNIIINNSKKEDIEKKLKSKLNDVINENNQLKQQLVDNKNFEEKMKNLIEENKKNKNINDIIMRDNQQLSKKLKDIQDYRNNNLIVQNLQSIDLSQEQKIQIEQLIKNNKIYLDKLKKNYLEKIVNKAINKKINYIKNNFIKYRNIVENIKNKENEYNYKKEKFVNILIKNIENKLKLIKKESFSKLKYVSIILQIKKYYKNIFINNSLKNIINNNEKKTKYFLCKAFFKYYYNFIKYKEIEKIKNDEEIEKQNKELSKSILLKKIFKRYHTNKLFFYRIFIEKWNLKSKIIGMKTAARDKKKKRKLKKKNNKFLYKLNRENEQKNNNSNLAINYYKNLQNYNCIFSEEKIINKSSYEKPYISSIRNKINNEDKINKVNNIDKNYFKTKKKTNSVSGIMIKNNNKKDDKENNNYIEDSDEDSGDSFGLDNNSE